MKIHIVWGDAGCHLRCGSAQWEVPQSMLCSPEDWETLRWYFEDFAEVDPLHVKLAADAEDILKEYKQALFRWLDFSSQLPVMRSGAKLTIEIEQSVSDTEGGSPVLWEALEDLKLWVNTVNPGSVTVLRKIGQKSSPGRPLAMAKSGLKILVVLARPQGSNDISYRYVSDILFGVVEEVHARHPARHVEIQIVRPGTFEAYQSHLSQYPPGSFDIVHFDLHGVERDGRIYLAFLTADANGIAADYIDPSQVADELSKAGVKCVILNACRSSAGLNADVNIAMKFIEKGVSWVVAMAYKIGSAALGVFLKSLYQGVLFSCTSLCEAIRIARHELRSRPLKMTRFGFQVQTDDSSVPLYFTASGMSDFIWLPPPSFISTLSASSKTSALKNDNQVSLDNKILTLETNLLLRCRVVLVTGTSGVGKSLLGQELVAWWKSTSFIRNAIVVELDITKDPDITEIEESLISSQCGRSLLLIDSFETLDDLPGAQRRIQLKRWKRLLKDLYAKPNVYIVLISRNPELWSQDLVLRNPQSGRKERVVIQPLSGFITSKGVNFVTKAITNSGRSNKSQEPDAIQNIEALVKLVDGNPLALQVLLDDFVKTTMSIRDYYDAVLGGRTVDVSATLLRSPGARIIRQIKIIENEALSPNAETREKLYSSQRVKIITGQRLSLRDTVHALGPTMFSFTWKAMPLGINHYFALYELEVLELMGKTGIFRAPNLEIIEARRWTRLVETDQLAGASPAEREEFEELLDELIQKLSKLRLLDLFNQSSSGIMPSYRVHPILPLIARTAPDYADFRKGGERPWYIYQTSLTLHWPHHFTYWNTVWDKPKEEAHLFFSNFYSALSMAAGRKFGNPLNEFAISRLLGALIKGVYKDLHRYFLIVNMAKKHYGRLVQGLRHSYGEDPRAHENADVLATFFSYLLEDYIPESSTYAWITRLFAIESLGNVAAILVGAYSGITEPEQERIRSDASGVLGECIKKVDEARVAHKLPERLATRIKVQAEFALKVILVRDSEDAKSFWELRTSTFKDMIEHFGVEKFPANQKGFLDSPHSLNSLSLVYSRMIDLQKEAESLIEGNNLRAARKLIQTELTREVNFGTNQAKSKLRLYLLLSQVDEKDEEWLDAIGNLNRAYALEDEMLQNTSELRKVKREGRLALLYWKAAEVETAMYYTRKLLRRANDAHGCDPDVEIMALLEVHKLPYSRKLDGDVSAIWLLVRAAKAAHRLGVEQKIVQKGMWLLTVSDVTNSSSAEWVAGSKDPRARPVTIVYLLQMFGTVILMPFWLHSASLQALTDKKASTYDDSHPLTQRCREAATEIELRVFAEDDSQLVYNQYVDNDWEKQRKLFEHLYTWGGRYLRGQIPKKWDGDSQWPKAPWAPGNFMNQVSSGNSLWGTAELPKDWTCSTELILELAGFIIKE